MRHYVPSRWNESNLRKIVEKASSIRGVITELGLVPAGGNYTQCHFYIRKYDIDTSHFTGQGWRKGKHPRRSSVYTLDELLTAGTHRARRNIKRRLFEAGLKKPECEECGWAVVSQDGRTPIELDHINGDNTDNRLENLRILCPNCHSLKPTHRGSNISLRRRDGEIGQTRRT